MNIENENFTPEELASFLYNELPVDPCSLKLIPYSPNMDNDQITFLFEILITFYMEGMVDAPRLYHFLETKENIFYDKKDIDIYNISLKDLFLCSPWLKSLGFLLFINEYKFDDYISDKHEYCKIILKCDKNYINFFKKNRIEKSYHFILYSNYISTNKLEDVKAVFFKYKDPHNDLDCDRVYTIKFKPLNMDSKCK